MSLLSEASRKVLREYPVYKYCYHQGDITKEKYIGREYDSLFVFLYGSEINPGPNGSRKRLDIREINNPCTSNLCTGVYLTEEDDEFAVEHFKKCLQERIDKANDTIKKYKKEMKILESILE